MDAVSRALASEVPLPISVLSELGKGSLRTAFRVVSQDVDVTQLLGLWKKLVFTATNPQVTDKHLTAASNALCVYLNSGSECSVDKVRALACSQEAWFDAFQCAHRGFNDGKTKPAFQILETLCDILRDKYEQAVVTEVLTKASLPLVRTVLLASPHAEVKKACHMLSCIHRKLPIFNLLHDFIRRSIEEHHFAWAKRLSEHNIHPEDLPDDGDGSITPFLLALIFTMIDLDTRSAALKLCTILCSSINDNSHLQALVERCIELYLQKNHAVLSDFAENVLPAVLSTREQFTAFLNRHAHSCYSNVSSMAFFLATLKVGRSKGILSDSEALNIFNTTFSSGASSSLDEVDDYLWFERMLTVADAEIRILTYGLLALSPNTSAVVPARVLHCVALCMKYLHDDADAHERSEILSITKRFLRRIQTSASVLRKTTSSKKCDKTVDSILSQYTSFSTKFYSFLKGELGAGLSYQRHILSLLSLQYFVDLALEPEIFTSDLEIIRALVCLVLDPFEDVRSTAANLLSLAAIKSPVAVQSVLTEALVDRVELLAVKTGRGDHADAMGRLWSLWDQCRKHNDAACEDAQNMGDATELSQFVCKLDQMVAESDNLKPGSDYTVHGSLRAVSYRLRDLKTRSTQPLEFDAQKVLTVCLKVWDHVRVYLCVDSPETASELEEEESNEGPKDLLAYSWRALRDSSLVMQSLIVAAPPSRDLYAAVGDICMDQLISLRHRGAFSTVAQTFTLCCEKVRLAKDPAVGELIQRWYKVALAQIEEQSARLTRRSAGLPAMVVALLSPTDPGFFASTMSDLMGIAALTPNGPVPRDESGEMKLPQVHALNCLKDIMTNSRFAILVTLFLSRMLELAATCLSSRIWAIRNCGLMLLRACINRLDTTLTSDADTSNVQSGNKGIEDTPVAIAFRLLNSASSHPDQAVTSLVRDTEHVFAALDLLGHTSLGGSGTEGATGIICQKLSHSTWAVRDHAALLLATSIANKDPASDFMKLVEDTALTGSQNQIHGILLCCRYVMEKSKSTLAESELDSIINALTHRLIRGKDHSPYVYAAWLDVLNDATAIILKNGWSFDATSYLSIFECMASDRTARSVHESYLLRRRLLHSTYQYLLVEERSLSPTREDKSLIMDFVANTDCLAFALDSLVQKRSYLPSRSLAILLMGLLNEGYEALYEKPDVLERVFACLSHCLKSARDLAPILLQTTSDKIDLRKLWCPRELRNSALNLQASLLVACQDTQGNFEPVTEAVEALFRGVEDASLDFLDFPTRLSAATAVSTYASHLQRPLASEASDQHNLRLLLILYELLNDDDQEVRVEAIQAARKLKLHEVAALDNLGISALCARERLLEELRQLHGSTPGIAEAALVKVMHIGRNPSSGLNQQRPIDLFQTSVAAMLLDIAKAKDDLFAEERQNLYVDDIREIESWVGLIDHGKSGLLPQDLFSAILKWALEGLDQISLILSAEQRSNQLHGSIRQDQQHQDFVHRDLVSRFNFWHPLSATYDHEVLVVVVKVVSLAGFLLHYETTMPLVQLREKLEQVGAACRDSQTNRVVIDAVFKALA